MSESDEQYDAIVSAIESAISPAGGEVLRLDEEGQLLVRTGEGTTVINVERMKQLIDSGEETLDSVVARFTGTGDRLCQALEDPELQKSGLRICLEMVWVLEEGMVIHYPVSDQLIAVLEWTDPEETGLVLLTDEIVACWPITKEEAWDIAFQNMRKLLGKAVLELAGSEDDLPIAFFNIDSPMKASLMLCLELKEHVTPIIGWPILALAPCRDFLYLLPDDDRGELAAQALGEVVVDEYNKSSYPLSTELFRISDDGIEAIGQYAAAGE